MNPPATSAMTIRTFTHSTSYTSSLCTHELTLYSDALRAPSGMFDISEAGNTHRFDATPSLQACIQTLDDNVINGDYRSDDLQDHPPITLTSLSLLEPAPAPRSLSLMKPRRMHNHTYTYPSTSKKASDNDSPPAVAYSPRPTPAAHH